MPQINNRNSFCHKLIRETAKEMAGAIYEEMAKDNDFYAKFPNQRAYINAAWPLLLEEARGVLAKLLTTQLSDKLKDEITEALILDNTLRADRAKIRWSN